jgi:TolB-like protein/Flp pilus assembly protein TadD
MTEREFQAPDLLKGFAMGPWQVEPWRNAIVKGGEDRHLENRLMQTLLFLAQNQGQVISRERFFDSVWQGRVVNEEALSRAISLLRTALGDDANSPQFIQTIPGVGYRLIASIETGQSHEGAALSSVDPQENSIAVLPFVNFSDDPENEYFSDGVTEEILNALAQVRRFKVVGRTSSFAFKEKNVDLREIGRTLDVTHVLEGSVRKANARVRITAQLIKSDDGYHLWSKAFDRDLDDIFAVQDEIAASVVKALKVKLLGEFQESQSKGGTNNTQAFQAYLKGVHYRNRGALKETVHNAVDAFQRATELDSSYARAYAGLAYAWIERVYNGYVCQGEGLRLAQDAARKAIDLAPGLAEGYLALGVSMQLDFPIKKDARLAINKARELNPGSTPVLIEYSRINCHSNNHETSIAAARRALELDPVSVFANHVLGHVLYFARRYEEAIPAFRQALALDPQYTKPHYFIGMSYHWMGDSEKALQEVEQEPLEWMKWTAATTILHRLGRTAEAEANFASLIEIGISENNFIQQADIHAQLGDIEQAFNCLDVAFTLRDPGLAQLLIDPFLDPVRDDPRFSELLTNVGFNTDGM